jgi:uncharacterized Zn-finger protein
MIYINAILILLISSPLCHTMNPTQKISSLPAHNNNNNNLPSEDENDESVEHVTKKIKVTKQFKCQHEDCIDRPGYASRCSLKVHERSHKPTLEEQKPYVCSICAHRSAQIGHLETHEATHAPTLPHPCIFENCTRSFARKHDLKKHENLMHLGISDFQCDICGLCLGRASNLKTHMRTHTGERSYSCECGQSFARSDGLNAHKKSCHKGNDNDNDDGDTQSIAATAAILIAMTQKKD